MEYGQAVQRTKLSLCQEHHPKIVPELPQWQQTLNCRLSLGSIWIHAMAFHEDQYKVSCCPTNIWITYYK